MHSPSENSGVTRVPAGCSYVPLYAFGSRHVGGDTPVLYAGYTGPPAAKDLCC